MNTDKSMSTDTTTNSKQKHACINGWTKASMLAHIKREFKGRSALIKNGIETCLYRGPEGKKCVAGIFIKDTEYNERMETISAYRLAEMCPINFPLERIFMGELQGVHDGSTEEQCLANILTWIEENVADSDEGNNGVDAAAAAGATE